MKAVRFVCSNCGSVAPYWRGKCPDCGQWNTISEERVSPLLKTAGRAKTRRRELVVVRPEQAMAAPRTARLKSGSAEFDSALSGGLTPGSVALVGGEPGIGKSTLLLQVLAGLKEESLYVSGEESTNQLAERAARLGLNMHRPLLATETEVGAITARLSKNPVAVAVIDSIQTMHLEQVESAPGSVLQLRAAAAELARVAKEHNICVIIIGHVTKDGQIAGPKVLEHIVDTVLYFEGDFKGQYRIIRSVKNRYGASGELGIFEMTGKGLRGVAEPSAAFLPHHAGRVEGSVAFCAMEGQRPLLLEIQALVAPSTNMVAPRRAVTGWSAQRMAMVLAVLDIRCGVNLSANEVYLNVTGGLKLSEPAVDLAAAAAILSSVGKFSAGPDHTVIFGELGLSGELRQVPHTDRRLFEANKRGFKQAIIPGGENRGQNNKKAGLAIREIRHIKELATEKGAEETVGG